jgi:gamma-glutamylcyclotransferase (GGCT)/AIG2-like uncharacterized protein YtfP
LKEPQYLFSYGSLQDEAVQLRIFKRRLKGKKANLKEYRLIENEYLGKFPIIHTSPKQDDIVNGIIFEVSEADLQNCDHYETNYYKRIRVSIKTHPSVWVYVKNSA